MSLFKVGWQGGSSPRKLFLWPERLAFLPLFIFVLQDAWSNTFDIHCFWILSRVRFRQSIEGYAPFMRVPLGFFASEVFGGSSKVVWWNSGFFPCNLFQRNTFRPSWLPQLLLLGSFLYLIAIFCRSYWGMIFVPWSPFWRRILIFWRDLLVIVRNVMGRRIPIIRSHFPLTKKLSQGYLPFSTMVFILV